MKVRILKCNESHVWYYNRIGEEYHVVVERHYDGVPLYKILPHVVQSQYNNCDLYIIGDDCVVTEKGGPHPGDSKLRHYFI